MKTLLLFNKVHVSIHITVHSNYLGCGDFPLEDLSVLPDPCPLPDKEKKRSLSEKERLIYAPMAGIGGVVYDKVWRSHDLHIVIM